MSVEVREYDRILGRPRAVGGGVPASTPQAEIYRVDVRDVPVRAASYNPRRTKIALQNQSTVVIRRVRGPGSTFAGGGFEIAVGQTYFDDVGKVYKGEFWLVADTAGPHTVEVVDESE